MKSNENRRRNLSRREGKGVGHRGRVFLKRCTKEEEWIKEKWRCSLWG